MDSFDSTLDSTLTPQEEELAFSLKDKRDTKKAKLIEKLDMKNIRRMSSKLSSIVSEEIFDSSNKSISSSARSSSNRSSDSRSSSESSSSSSGSSSNSNTSSSKIEDSKSSM